MQEKAKEKEAKNNKEKQTEEQKSQPPPPPPPHASSPQQDEKQPQNEKRQTDAPSPDIPPHRNLNPEQIAVMELTSKVEKMELEAHKTSDRLSEVGVQKDALERDVATMKTENDRLRCVHLRIFEFYVSKYGYFSSLFSTELGKS